MDNCWRVINLIRTVHKWSWILLEVGLMVQSEVEEGMTVAFMLDIFS
jgi:hypothetical protein